MDIYRSIVVGVDLNVETDTITINRAKQLATTHHAKLYLVHAVESLNAYGTAYVDIAVNNIEKEISAEHKEQLLREAEQQGIPSDALIVEVGTPAHVIINQARKLPADLIVVGTHSHHGLSLLFGSTTDSILHDAPCDVLGVYLNK